MNEVGLLDGDAIRRLVTEVGDALAGADGQRTLIMVGGSLLAWHGMRDTTEDVDSIRRLDDELRFAATQVAARHGLAVTWLNDAATAFAPATLDTDACELLLDHPQLRVLGAPLTDVFLMKLRRSEPADLDDMRALWPSVSDEFATSADVVAAFREAFPYEPDDEFLGEFLVDELAKGGFELPMH